jgi:hypothetical protein
MQADIEEMKELLAQIEAMRRTKEFNHQEKYKVTPSLLDRVVSGGEYC